MKLASLRYRQKNYYEYDLRSQEHNWDYLAKWGHFQYCCLHVPSFWCRWRCHVMLSRHQLWARVTLGQVDAVYTMFVAYPATGSSFEPVRTENRKKLTFSHFCSLKWIWRVEQTHIFYFSSWALVTCLSSVHVVITIHDVPIPMNLAGTEECKIKTIELSP